MIALLVLADPLGAQGAPRRLDLQYGWWVRDDGGTAVSFAARSSRRLVGPVLHGLTAQVLVDRDLGRRLAFYGAGYELTAFRAERGIAVYPLAGVLLGLSTDSSGDELGALWRIGAGLEWRPLHPVALGVEGAYTVEDRGPRGFWRLGDSRAGWRFAFGVTAHWGGGGSGGATARAAGRTPVRRPGHVSGPAAAVVETALDALGTPYAWGGTSENGFDCSGLIQYAYGLHGVSLPRRSRDQAVMGEPVPRAPAALVPGDILAFSAQPGGAVTHVGLYVGDGLFLHSATDGVKLSALRADDPDGGYWLPRWVGVRRILP